MRFHVDRLHVGDPVTVAEMHSTAIGRCGLPYDQIYAWICTFDGDTIVNVHAYVDSVAVIEFLDRNGYRP
jgi:ketosteroid isomerase-like protein